MKKIIALFITIILLMNLCACGRTYTEAEYAPESCAGGYFTIIREWGGGGGPYYCIMYANDTKVIYFYEYGGSARAITPLYNADGTLQIYQGE